MINLTRLILEPATNCAMNKFHPHPLTFMPAAIFVCCACATHNTDDKKRGGSLLMFLRNQPQKKNVKLKSLELIMRQSEDIKFFEIIC